MSDLSAITQELVTFTDEICKLALRITATGKDCDVSTFVCTLLNLHSLTTQHLRKTSHLQEVCKMLVTL